MCCQTTMRGFTKGLVRNRRWWGKGSQERSHILFLVLWQILLLILKLPASLALSQAVNLVFLGTMWWEVILWLASILRPCTPLSTQILQYRRKWTSAFTPLLSQYTLSLLWKLQIGRARNIFKVVAKIRYYRTICWRLWCVTRLFFLFFLRLLDLCTCGLGLCSTACFFATRFGSVGFCELWFYILPNFYKFYTSQVAHKPYQVSQGHYLQISKLLQNK